MKKQSMINGGLMALVALVASAGIGLLQTDVWAGIVLIALTLVVALIREEYKPKRK